MSAHGFAPAWPSTRSTGTPFTADRDCEISAAETCSDRDRVPAGLPRVTMTSRWSSRRVKNRCGSRELSDPRAFHDRFSADRRNLSRTSRRFRVTPARHQLPDRTRFCRKDARVLWLSGRGTAIDSQSKEEVIMKFNGFARSPKAATVCTGWLVGASRWRCWRLRALRGSRLQRTRGGQHRQFW